MQLSDLIIFGRLGNIVSGKRNTFAFKPNSNFQPIIFLNKKEIFLIFDNTKVRYTDYEAITSEKDYRLIFNDYFIIEDIKIANHVLVALSPDDYNSICEEDNGVRPNIEVFYQNENIGQVVSSFFNGTYDTIIVKNIQKEMMIPLVDIYVRNITEQRIDLKNIDGLMKL